MSDTTRPENTESNQQLSLPEFEGPLPHSGDIGLEKPVNEFDNTTLETAATRGLIEMPDDLSALSESDREMITAADPSETDSEAAVKNQANKRKAFMAAGAGLLLAAGIFIGTQAGGEDSKNDDTEQTGAAPGVEQNDGNMIEEETVVNNVCDVLTPESVANTLGISETSVTGRGCYSDLPRGIITEVDWNTSEGVYLSALVMKDSVVGQTSVRNPDGSLSGFGDFNDYHSLQASEYFSLQDISGEEYSGAFNSQSMRVQVGEHVIAIQLGNEGTGQAGAEYMINSVSQPRYIELAKSLVERVFDTQITN